MKHTVDADLEALPYCCGVYEAGRFDEDYDDDDFVYGFKTIREAWEEKLKRLRADCLYSPIVLNFVKYKNEKRFENWEFRKLINEQPDALIVHKFTNPNSGNIVEMYVLTNGSKV